MSYTDQEHANLRLVTDIYEKVLKPLDPTMVDRFFDPGYIQHSPMAETGAEGLKRFLAHARFAAPLATHEVKRLFVDGDHVIAQVHVVLSPGEPGNAVIDIFRLQDGRAVEHWDVGQAVPAAMQHNNGMF